MAQPVRWARLVRKAWQEMMELQARKARLDFKVSRASMVQPARWARLVRKAWLEMMELRAHKVRLDLKVWRASMAQPARWDQLVQLAQLVRRALQEMMERRVPQVHRAHRVRLDLKASRVWMVQPARWARPAQLVRKALQEMMERRAHRARKVRQVRLDPRERVSRSSAVPIFRTATVSISAWVNLQPRMPRLRRPCPSAERLPDCRCVPTARREIPRIGMTSRSLSTAR